MCEKLAVGVVKQIIRKQACSFEISACFLAQHFEDIAREGLSVSVFVGEAADLFSYDFLLVCVLALEWGEGASGFVEEPWSRVV